MATGTYDVVLFAEHGLNPAKLRSGQLWTDRMSMEASTRGSFSSFDYNKQALENQVGTIFVIVGRIASYLTHTFFLNKGSHA